MALLLALPVAQVAAQELPPEIAARAASGPTFLGSGQGAGFRPAAGSIRSALSGAGAGLRDAISAGRANPLRSLAPSSMPASAESATRLQRLRSQQQVRRQIAARSTAPAVRPTRHQIAHVLTLGFDDPPALRSADEQSAALSDRLNDLGERLGGHDFSVRIVGTKAIVTGMVAHERYRSLVSRVLSLEPNIHEIDNRLTIAPASATNAGRDRAKENGS